MNLALYFLFIGRQGDPNTVGILILKLERKIIVSKGFFCGARRFGSALLAAGPPSLPIAIIGQVPVGGVNIASYNCTAGYIILGRNKQVNNGQCRHGNNKNYSQQFLHIS
jgi:hypothetical protein